MEEQNNDGKQKEKQRTRAAIDHYDTYLRSTWKNIFQAYGKPSKKKIDAYEYCENLCKKMNGYGLKIITRNTDVFTAGFMSVDDEGNLMFTYIAPTFDATIPAEIAKGGE